MSDVTLDESAVPATATSWLDDDKNFATDSPAAKQMFLEVPKSAEHEATPEELVPKTDDEPSAREKIQAEIAPKDDDAAEEPGYTQDEQGKWHRPDGGFADAKEIEAIEALNTEATTPAADATEAPTEAPKPTAVTTKQPIGDITVYDKDGKAVESLPDVTITYKANGKTLEKVPLDKLIRTAQNGHYNEAKEQEVLATRQKAQSVETENIDLKALVKQYEDATAVILANREAYEKASALYQQQNTPEARLQTLEAQLRDRDSQAAQSQQQQQMRAYVEAEIKPRFTALTEKVKAAVSPEAMFGKFALLTNHLLVNGVIPPQRLPDVVRIIEQDITPWAESQLDSKSATESEQVKKANKRVLAAQVTAALAKKQMARVAAPSGSAPPLREAPKAPPAPKTAEESVDQMFAQFERKK